MFLSRLFRFIVTALLVGNFHVSVAATLIEQAGDANNPPTKMWLKGMKMRADVGKTGQYMLVDMGKKKMYVVDPAKKMALDNSQMFAQGPANTAGLKVQVKHLGGGPVIAGYKTQKYSTHVNGQQCDQVFVSKKAMIDTGMQNMMEAMSSMGNNPFGGQQTLCERADGLFAKRMKKLGIPLGAVKNGKVEKHFTRIVTNATPPASGFTLPKGYKVLTMQQFMMEMMKKQMQGQGR